MLVSLLIGPSYPPLCKGLFYVNLLFMMGISLIGPYTPLCTSLFYVNLLIRLGSSLIGPCPPLLCTSFSYVFCYFSIVYSHVCLFERGKSVTKRSARQQQGH
jgi:hypothetical protein